MRRGSWFLKTIERMSSVVFPARRSADVSRLDVDICDLATSFDGYTIVALADLHHRSRFQDVRWLRRAVDIANASAPDIVVLLGDYGSSFKQAPTTSSEWYAEALSAMTPELQRLHARDGVVAVLGNHDYYAGSQLTATWLREVGVDVLVNQSCSVERSGHRLRFTGLDDLNEGTASALPAHDLYDRTPTIVLAHHPDSIDTIPSQLRVDLVVAGHTHGGQIVLPWLGAVLTMSRKCRPKSAHGWIANPRAPLYVTRGLGEQLPLPVRFRCEPEIVVLRLRAVHQQPA